MGNLLSITKLVLQCDWKSKPVQIPSQEITHCNSFNSKAEILYGITLLLMAPEQYFLIEQEICYVICHEFQFDSNMFYCWQFLLTVDPVDAPGYYKVIKNPMDFGTIRVKLEVSQITFEIILLLTIILQHNGTILWLCYFQCIYFSSCILSLDVRTHLVNMT